jgi:hypothetical protein
MKDSLAVAAIKKKSLKLTQEKGPKPRATLRHEVSPEENVSPKKHFLGMTIGFLVRPREKCFVPQNRWTRWTGLQEVNRAGC